MPRRFCRACKTPLHAADNHGECVSCLGLPHAEAALKETECPHCGDMSLSSLRSRIVFFSEHDSAPRALPFPPSQEPVKKKQKGRGSQRSELGELTSAQPPRASPSPQREGSPVLFTHPDLCPSAAASDLVSFGGSEDDMLDSMSLAASDAEELSGSVNDLAPPAGCGRAGTGVVSSRGAPHTASSMSGTCRVAARPPRQRASPFLPEVHEELTRSWHAPYSARLRPSSSSALTTVDGAEDKGYEKLPPLDESVAAHLCLPTAIGWKTKASHPSKPCRTASALAGRAYTSAGQAASALHSMAILQVFQAKLLAQSDRSALDPATLTELRSATDLALRATKATAQAIGRSMANLVVLERHLWLMLTEIKDADKVPFLDAPISPTGLFGPSVEGFAERFSAAQKTSQAMRHLLPKRSSSTAASGRPKPTPPQQPVRPASTAPSAAAATAQPAKAEPRLRSRSARRYRFPKCQGPRPRLARKEEEGAKSRTSRTTPQKASVEPPSTPLNAGCRGQCVLCKTCCKYWVHFSCAHTTSRCDSEQNKTQTFSKREQISSSNHKGCLVPSRWSATRANYTPGHSGRGLAGYPRSVRLGNGDNKKRLLTPVRSKAPALQRRGPHRVKEQGRARPTLGGVDIAGKRRHRGSPPSPEQVGVLQPLLPHPQEGWGSTTHPRFKAFESGPHETAVQNVNLDAALFPLRQKGIRILNYLDDWLILAQSEAELLSHRALLLSHLECLGLRVNLAKSVLHPSRQISFLGAIFDSTQLRAMVVPERALAIRQLAGSFRAGALYPLKRFQRMLGLMASASPVLELGLLRMRPLQRWLKPRVPPHAWRHGRLRVRVDQTCVEALVPWKGPQWFERGVPLGSVCRRKVVTTDASNKVWGALCDGNPAFGLWSKAEEGFHINCLEMLAVCHALCAFLPDLKGHHVLIRSDSMTVVSYINRQGGLSSRHLFTLVKGLLEWAQLNLASLRAVHVPGRLNQGADMLSRSNVPSGEWTLHPQTVQKIWEVFGKAEVDLFASKDNSHCPIYFSKDRDALAHDWPNLLLYAFPLTSLIPQVLKRVREQHHKLLLVAPLWRTQPWFSELCQLLCAAPWPIPPEAGPSLSGERVHMAPPTQSVGLTPLVFGRESENLPEGVLNTISQARAPSTRRLYALKWSVFSTWCSTRGKNPASCDISVILSFLQELLDKGRSPSTLKVYVAAIAAFHAPIADQSIGRNNLVVRFLKGSRRINPSRPHTIPTWDLSTTALLLALVSVKRIGDLQALSISPSCLEFGPGDSKVILKPRHGYVPKVPSTPFRAQVVTLSALPSSEGDQELSLLCPVRALRLYIERSASFRQSDQLFVCFGGHHKGQPVTKQRLSRWIVDAITLAYSSLGLECPIGVRVHLTRGVASSWAWSSGVSMAEICAAAGWASPSTFTRFYSLDIPALQAGILSA
ncbi:ORF V: Enzymatic polyprotein [Labeo rohita]|uniref:ribonuclease H n=1 Tax=Labeo rohita TaxID=84645 RepID=A0ABQ8MN46_LABRO|nr:ORF V: Enzymatic polyprotein [Labeo rohita]